MTSRQLLFKKFPRIETKHLVLRKLTHFDSDDLDELFNSQDIQMYQSHVYYSREDLYNYVESQNYTFNNHEIIKWVIERKSDGKFIGVRILYCDDNSGWVEIQGDTKKEYWRMGYTKEAYKGIIKHLRSLNFKGVRSVIQYENTSAKFLLKSLNFKLFNEFFSNGLKFQEYRLNLDYHLLDKIKCIFN